MTDARMVREGVYLTNETKLVEVVEVLDDGRVRTVDAQTEKTRLILPASLKYWRVVTPKKEAA